jgi:formate--tetrahydrofolate ligase
VERGMENLARHLRNIREVFGIPCVVALNRFPTDTDREVALVVDLVDDLQVRTYPATHFVDGGAGATELAKGVLDLLENPGPMSFSFAYPDGLPLQEKAETLAHRLYGASSVTWDGKAKRRLDRFEADGYGGLPICVAKTQYSFSTDATLRGAPTGHDLHVREVRLSAGAGFIVLVCGDVMTMPGLPVTPAASRIDLLDDGTIVGLS